MKTIAIIPARGGSKRLLHKNALLLDGIPLVAHSILYAQQNHLIIDEIYVSTDDNEIKKIALQYGAKVIDRPPSISGSFEPTITALQHTLQHVDSLISTIVLLQPTNPLRPKNLLKEAFNCFENNDCDSLFTVTRNHNKLGKIIENKYYPFNYSFGQRSQDLEPLYFENGLLYITKAAFILEHKIITENAFPLEVNHIFASVDIDTQDDFEYATYLIKKESRL
ncbi:acylneuraminate cytidylyltransferase family protein [Flavobacterium restrictum]|uniref:Acylneuraminate cytidylyltransferase family protein n=1 Tax=Flavobacterium restrictum TaxID=2594428 RepID=A0A553E8V3_9FLAO|nr:acylneuraminate cytidylyltransferase family protein [Flavobacterium restrictum]TRX41253.1 acylneuraminate cytidylyltransferase family protein [Flavobacterium restrictum]